MKQVLTVLAVTGLIYCSANAQLPQNNTCGVMDKQVCRISSDRKTVSCYKTQYAENYKVCKNNYGYYICCETPDLNNSTYKGLPENVAMEPYTIENTPVAGNKIPPVDMTAPQSQSYVMQSSNTYEGYYPKRGRIKVCYVGDNVAMNNRAPYEGCPSPQYDGPELNKLRNMNVNNPVGLSPIAGKHHKK